MMLFSYLMVHQFQHFYDSKPLMVHWLATNQQERVTKTSIKWEKVNQNKIWELRNDALVRILTITIITSLQSAATITNETNEINGGNWVIITMIAIIINNNNNIYVVYIIMYQSQWQPLIQWQQITQMTMTIVWILLKYVYKLLYCLNKSI